MLRLVVLKRGKKRVHFVTSILNPNILSDQKLLSIAKRRWGVEVFFRSWKQTFDKRKLRSRKSEHALIELDWALFVVILSRKTTAFDRVPAKIAKHG